MEGKNLLIIGGVVALGGYYLVNKKKKEKEKADELAMLLASQAKANKATSIPLVTSNLLTDAEAKVYATRTIAQVNSLIAKYPALTKEQFLQEYNAVNKTNLFVDGNGEIAFPKIAIPANTSASQVTLIYFPSVKRANDAKRVFDGQQRTRNFWKTSFATVYKDLKDYYATLTKEKANKVIRFLPKVIVRAMLGENDNRARVNEFFTEIELIEIVDSKIDFEAELKIALRGFFSSLKTPINPTAG